MLKICRCKCRDVGCCFPKDVDGDRNSRRAVELLLVCSRVTNDKSQYGRVNQELRAAWEISRLRR